jgi:large subunit ribosomal protein L25
MTIIKAKIRDKSGETNNFLRKNEFIPAILYGEGIKNISLKINTKDFEEVYKEAGESSLITLKIDDKEFLVLIHQIARGPIKGEFLHIDFYHPSTKKKVEAEIPLIFEGEAPGIKELGAILEKQFRELEVKGLAKDLPKEIIVNVENLKTFEDKIYIKDLKIPEGVMFLKDSQEIVAHLAQPRDIEKELAEEEKPEEVVEGEENKEGEEKKEGDESESSKQESKK